MARKKTIDEVGDRVHLVFPLGCKSGLREYLRARFGNENINAYVKTLIELDLMGKVEWGADIGNFPLLRQMAKVEKK